MREVRVRPSIHQAPLPPPGTRREPWRWEDVLDGGGPTPRPSLLVVRHGADEAPDADVRLAFATLVEARDGALDVEERVAVEPRVLGRVIRVERALTRHVGAGTEVGARLVVGGTAFVGRHVPGRPGQVVAQGGGLAARGLRWASDSVRDGLHALVEAPDRLAAGASVAGAHLQTRGGRRLFLRGLLDPHGLSREGKAASLFLAGVSLAVLLAVATLGVVFLAPEGAVAWRALVSYFALGVGSTLLFPFFPEFRLAEVAAVAGPVPAVLAVVLGMTVGGWFVLFLGDAVHGALRRSAKPGSPLARLLDKAEDFARRRGFWAAFLILAIPLGPDTPVFYTLATVRTPVTKYLAGTFLGTLVRFSLFYALSGLTLPLR